MATHGYSRGIRGPRGIARWKALRLPTITTTTTTTTTTTIHSLTLSLTLWLAWVTLTSDVLSSVVLSSRVSTIAKDVFVVVVLLVVG